MSFSMCQDEPLAWYKRTRKRQRLLVNVNVGGRDFPCQRAKEVVSDSPGLVDFAFGPVIFVCNLPDRQVLFFWGKFKLQDCNQFC